MQSIQSIFRRKIYGKHWLVQKIFKEASWNLIMVQLFQNKKSNIKIVALKRGNCTERNWNKNEIKRLDQAAEIVKIKPQLKLRIIYIKPIIDGQSSRERLWKFAIGQKWIWELHILKPRNGVGKPRKSQAILGVTYLIFKL